MSKICGENHWKERLILLINTHNIELERMGFPADWREKLIWV